MRTRLASPARGCADVAAQRLQPMARQTPRALGNARRRHLQHRAQFLGKAGGDGIRHLAQIDVEAAMGGKGHLQDREQHTAVRAVVVGEQQSAILQFAQRRKKARAIARGCRDPPARRRSCRAPAPSSCRPGGSCPPPDRSATGARAATNPIRASASRGHPARAQTPRRSATPARSPHDRPRHPAMRFSWTTSPCRPEW